MLYDVDALTTKLDNRLVWSQIHEDGQIVLTEQETIDIITLLRMYSVQHQVDDALGAFLKVVLSD